MQTSSTVYSISLPAQKEVQIGLANDTQTEIKEGLNEGDKIISQTLSGSSSASASRAGQNSSAIRIPGLGGGTPVSR